MSEQLSETLSLMAQEIARLKKRLGELERMDVARTSTPISDHGSLTGLGDNDHPQYLLTTGEADVILRAYNASPAANVYYKIATLPASSAATHDHLTIEGVGSGWTDTEKTYYRITFSRRNTFTYDIQTSGSLFYDFELARIIAYEESGGEISVYLVAYSGYYSYMTVHLVSKDDNTIVYYNPTGVGTAPTGTAIFDMKTSVTNNGYETGWNVAPQNWSVLDASAGQIVVNPNEVADDNYAVGDKIRLTNDGSEKYFSIIDIPTTSVLTVTGGTDYALVGSAYTELTNCWISHASSPVGFPDWFNWTPTVTYSGGSADPTSCTINEAIFSIVRETLYFRINAELTRGSGDRTQTIFSAPITVSGNLFPLSTVHYITGAGLVTCAAWIESTSIKINHGTMSSDGWMHVSGFYRI